MLNWKRLTEAAMCLALIAGCASVGSDMAPADIVQQRKAGMQAAAKANGALKTQLAAPSPNTEAVKAAAASLAGAFDQVHTWWPASTQGEPSAKTKPEAFTDKAGFRKQVDGVRAASRKLGAAAKGDDIAAIKAAYEQVTPFCASCHVPYRIMPARPPAAK
jgi:cytochrome c556